MGGRVLPFVSFRVRGALLYAALFFLIGVYLPFFPVWLKSRGLTADEIASILCRLNDRGVVVKVITDSEQVHSTGSVVQTLRSCGKK